MNGNLRKMCEESFEEWADIQKQISIRQKKDKTIISTFCAQNNEADIIRILELFDKHKGLPEHDKQIIKKFKDNYPTTLTVDMINDFEDTKDIYSKYLESGGENQ